MMPLNSFISAINDHICNLVPGIKVYGLTRSVIRKQGTVTETLPGIVAANGEIKYVGIDDLYSVQVYHRLTGITTGRETVQGYGDGYSNLINTYALGMYVYLDRKRVDIEPEELFLYLQANMPDSMKYEPFTLITLDVTTVNLNSEQLFSTEYRGASYPLPAEKSIFLINYTIRTVLKKQCFAKCPEGIKTNNN